MTCHHLNWSEKAYDGLLSRICHDCNLFEIEVEVESLRAETARLTAQLESVTSENHDRARREARSLEDWASLRAEIERLRDERRQLRRRLVECRPWVGVCPLEPARINELCLVRDLADDTLNEVPE